MSASDDDARRSERVAPSPPITSSSSPTAPPPSASILRGAASRRAGALCGCLSSAWPRYRPTGQGAHADASASRSTPLPPKWYRFGAHASHLKAPRCAENRPTPHSLHAAAFTPLLNRPGAQTTHADPARNEPGAHAGVGDGVGATVGVTVGAAVGAAEGAAEGAAVGIAVGVAVGVAVGTAVGATVGNKVGAAVGAAVGLPVTGTDTTVAIE